MEDRSVEAENIRLLENICELLKTPDCMKPEVVLLIGRNGAGKSAVINTLHKVLTGQYFEIAETGRGKASTVTLDINWYTNCGVKSHRITDEVKKWIIKDIIPQLPHIIDCPGLEDENTHELKETLELLLGGYIPPGTTTQVFEDLRRRHATKSLRETFKEQNPQWKVSKIVFVQGCVDGIPGNLISCLNETLQQYDETSYRRKYKSPVLVLVTKYDLIADSDDPELEGRPEERSISKEALHKLEASLAHELNFTGSLGTRRFRWVSFTDTIGYDNAQVEKIALKFLKKIVEPGMPEPPVLKRKKLELVKHYLGNTSMADKHFFTLLNCLPVLIGLAVIYIFYLSFKHGGY